MCVAIRFNRYEISDEELLAHSFALSGDEVRVSFVSKNPLIPVHYRGRNVLLPWGNKNEASVPKTGYCKMESLESGKWQWLRPEKVIILAKFALINGVWFQVRQGITGVLVKDKAGRKYCYVLTKPSTHYFKVMTGSIRMPDLVNQIL